MKSLSKIVDAILPKKKTYECKQIMNKKGPSKPFPSSTIFLGNIEKKHCLNWNQDTYSCCNLDKFPSSGGRGPEKLFAPKALKYNTHNQTRQNSLQDSNLFDSYI